MGRHLDDGLEQIGRLRPPGAAVGIDRRRVGVDRIDRAMDRRRLVLPGEQGGIQVGRHAGGEGRQIGAHIRDRVDLQRGEVAVGIERQLGLGDVVAAMGVGEEALAALPGPLDRPAEPLGGEQADALLGVDEDLGAEAAADVGRDHPELVLGRHADERRDHEARDVRVLARGVEREGVGGAIVLADRGARLDRVRHQAVVDQLDRGDVGGAGDRLVDRRRIAELPLVDRVPRDLVVDLRLALIAGVRGRHAGRQDLVVDLDQLGGILGLVVARGDHAGDVVADVARLALGQDRVRPGLHVGAVPGLHHPAADQAAPAGRLDVVAGQHREHAGGRLGRGSCRCR